MSEIITTLHPENDENINLYPNIKGENIPDGSVVESKLGEDVLNILNGIDTRLTNAIATIQQPKYYSTLPTSDMGLIVYSDGYLYSWDGTQYVTTNILYQALQIAFKSIGLWAFDDFDLSFKDSINYFDVSTLDTGKYIYNGQEVANADWAVTPFIEVEQTDILYVAYANGLNLPYVSFYDSNYNYIGQAYANAVGSTKNIIADINIKYLKYNVRPNSGAYTYNKQFCIIKKQKNYDKFYVSKTRTMDKYHKIFTTLKECTEFIQTNSILNATIYVDAGTYDLVSEFGQTYLDNISSDTNKGFGLKIGNNTHLIFNEGANVVFNYTGSNVKCAEYFSPFNVYGSFTLENANIEVSNARYCVHEDIPSVEGVSVPNQYIAIYKNCVMKHNGNTIGTYDGTVCIGAGVNKNSLSIVEGGTYENNPNSFNYPISYHNYYGSYKSRIIIKNVYLKNGALRFADFGLNIVDVEITNCKLPNGYVTTPDTQYFNIIAWNNI